MVIFDFDGVLCDSFDTLYKINKESADTLGIKLSERRYRNFFNGNIHKTRNVLFKGNAEKKQKFGQTREKLFNLYYKDGNVKIFEEAPEFLEKLSKKTKIYIVSSSPEKFIKKILEKYNLKFCFKDILGTNIAGKRKTIQNLLNKSYKNEISYFITDTVGDLQEVEGLKVKTIAVCWGFHDINAFLKFKPNYFVKNFDDLKKILL